MPKIMICGEILVEVMTTKIDQSFLEPGTLVGPYPSGAPAIFISQVARMGTACGIISQVGDDDFGRINTNRLQADGVDISQIAVTPEHTTGVAFVTYFADGSRQFIYHFKDAACGLLEEHQVKDEAFDDCEYYHVMGCSLSASESICRSVLKGLRIAKSKGAKISFDPNLRPELLGNKAIRDAFAEVMESADILQTGKSELKLLFPDDQDAVKRLLAEKGRIIIVKDGSRGTSVYTRNEAFSVPVYPAVEVDPTGAGDCFDGTMLACLASGKSLQDAACYANTAGALAVSKKGPMEGNSFRAEIEAKMKEHPLTVTPIM
jgi:sugar/nucleoside kinase (ribokinase family)